MSTYYTIACHTCKKKIDCSGYTRDAVAKRAGEWAMWGHIAHDISILHDNTGWNEKYDEKWFKVDQYDEVGFDTAYDS
ncbi:hypothetical protein Goe16_01610 [Bacillus phage vB_BsuM-Goe16]|nr:hypothetical protein Goe16_01610 [Bacillus phage vB_BsuM-Goe16]